MTTANETITATVTNKAGEVITAELPEGDDWNAPVVIDVNGVEAGQGIWQDGALFDCCARLGDTPDETEALYEALSTALRAVLAD